MIFLSMNGEALYLNFSLIFYGRGLVSFRQGKMGFGDQTPTAFFHKSFRITIVKNIIAFLKLMRYTSSLISFLFLIPYSLFPPYLFPVKC